jgi:hypothetical protein
VCGAVSSARRKLLPPALLLVIVTVLAAVVGNAGAATTEHATSTTLKCEPTEGPVSAPRICQATVTDIAPEPTLPTGQIVLAGGFSCSAVQSGPVSATCSIQVTAKKAGTYSVQMTYFGDVTHTSSIGEAPLVAGPPGSLPGTSLGLTGSAVGAPSLTLVKGPPKKTRSTSATFVFKSETAGTRFECRLDKAFYKPCTSPVKIGVNAGESHIFRIHAIGTNGTYAEKAIEYKWTVLAKKKAPKKHR